MALTDDRPKRCRDHDLPGTGKTLADVEMPVLPFDYAAVIGRLVARVARDEAEAAQLLDLLGVSDG